MAMPWTPVQERAMLAALRAGSRVDAVATTMGTTVADVRRHQRTVATRLCAEGMPLAAAAAMAGLHS